MPPTYVVLLVPLLFSVLVATASTAAATDTVSPSRPLAGGDKLVSSNGKFALGFFPVAGGSAGTSTAPKWYLGIWFNTVPKLTPAWVAKRENPLADGASSELAISGDDGNLVVRDRASKSVLWSTRANTTTNATVAVLQDSGNLVLISGGSSPAAVFWESFAHMTDTFLPGAKMGWSRATGLSRGLVSNKNYGDLAAGVFSAAPQPSPGATGLLLLWKASVQYWSSGQWNGEYFSNMPQMSGRALFTFEFVANEQEEYFTYRLKNDTLITRYVVDVSGQAKNMIWDVSAGDWITFFAEPGAQCDVYAVCGAFTVCRDDMLQFCSCMDGFSVRSEQDWQLGDRTGGCVRNIPLRCDTDSISNRSVSDVGDRFYAMAGVRLPANARYMEAGASDDCARACLNDCSCTAYSYGGDRCAIWNGDLLNVGQRYNGSNSALLYVRLAAEHVQGSSRDERGMVIGLAIAACIFSASLCAAVTMLVRRKKASSPGKIRGGMVSFRYKDLQRATRNFSERLGGGSFGSVFKGVLPDSTAVAVKRLDGARQGEKEFRAEVRSIGMIQHINLVRLIGFCCEGRRRLLVYEYMPNRSLDAHLFQSGGGGTPALSWSTRRKIALGVARGLAYIHESCQERIIHCDIKPQNILLDASLAPKIADFGMAKLMARGFSQALTTVRGTVGYMAPEWIAGVAISPKVDVYSYGMVLLEIVFGRRNQRGQHATDADADETYLPVQVVSKLLEGNLKCLLDHDVEEGTDLEEVERACRVACWCIQDDESNRPTMCQVVQILDGLLHVGTPPMPKLLQAISGCEDSTSTDVV